MKQYNMVAATIAVILVVALFFALVINLPKIQNGATSPSIKKTESSNSSYKTKRGSESGETIMQKTDTPTSVEQQVEAVQ